MIADLAATTAAPDARFTRGGVARGVRQTIPLGLGAIAFGAAFGILARNSSLSDAGALPNALLMSLVVYSGTAQIVGIELWSAGASNWAIWGATALVSIRYVLLGFTMRDWFHGLPRTVVYPSLFLTADQSWALTHAEMSSRTSSGTSSGKWDAGFFLGCNLTLAAGWIAGTALGVIAGGHIPDPSAWGLEFAATGAFIAILAGTYRGRTDIAPWIVAAGVALITERIVPGQWFVLAGALSGSIAGAVRSTTRHEP
jgi:4-azaleucine resistance transporter AzlC